MAPFKATVWRYFGEDGYKKPSPIASFSLEAVDSEVAEELAQSMVYQMPEVFVIVEEAL